jgi:putative ABC transport system permease protein
MLVGESLLISLMGGVLGLVTARVLFIFVDRSKVTMGFLRHFEVEPSTLGLGCLIALVVGVITGGLPALQVTRLTVSEGLRRLG